MRKIPPCGYLSFLLGHKISIMASTKKKKAEVATETTKDMVVLFKTTYHRYRHWIKSILGDGKISKFAFKKDEVGYTGVISVERSEVEKAKQILADYKAKNPDTVEMWW